MSDNSNGAIGYDVDYDTLDGSKRMALAAAMKTVGNLPSGITAVEDSFGGSVSLVELPDFYLAFVLEGLGTLNLVDEALFRMTGASHSVIVAQHTAASILNDLAACGARPLITNQFIAAGSSDWFSDRGRNEGFIDGWQVACDITDSMWGGGETQQLRDMVLPQTAVLAGGSVGIIKPKSHRIVGDVVPGDVIVVVRSSGVHQNGLTMARDVAATLPDSYATRMPNGMLYGQALLQPPIFYGPLIQAALEEGIPIHYVSNITGHGWRKIMRLPNSGLRYIISKLPSPHPVFKFIQEHSGASHRVMYETFNMGGGAAFYLDPQHATRFLILAEHIHYLAKVVGRVEEGPRSVLLEPIGVEFVSGDYSI